MHIKQLAIPFILLASMSACGNKNHDGNVGINEILSISYFGADSHSLIPSILDSLMFIPLYGSIDHPIAHVDDLQINDQGYFILDQHRNIIHAYSPSGDYLYQIDATGKGPGEYLEIGCFSISDSALYTVDNYAKKINKYDIRDGSFIKNYDTPITVGGMRKLNNGNFLLCELPIEGATQTDASDGSRIYLADSTLKIIGSSLPFKNGRDKIQMPQLLKGGDGTISYGSYGYNGYTLLDSRDGHVVGNVSVTTSKPFNQAEIKDMQLTEALDFIDNNGYKFLVSTPLDAGRYVVFTIKEGQNGEVCVYDKVTSKKYFNSNTDFNNLFICPDESYNGKFYTIYNFGADFLDTQLKSGFNKPPHVADSIIRNDGTVLLCYTMKE